MTFRNTMVAAALGATSLAVVACGSSNSSGDSSTGDNLLPNGAAILAATTRNNAGPNLPSLELALERRIAAAKAGPDMDISLLPSRDPYGKGYDDRVEAAAPGDEHAEPGSGCGVDGGDTRGLAVGFAPARAAVDHDRPGRVLHVAGR